MTKDRERKDASGLDHSQQAYKGIRRKLYHKELVPGQKIAYRELAEQLDMSPTPIIQALKWLEIQGFVRHEPHRVTIFREGDVESKKKADKRLAGIEDWLK